MSESADTPPETAGRARGSLVLPLAYGSALLCHLLFLKSLVFRLSLDDLGFVLAATSAFAGLFLPSVTLSATFSDAARRFGGADAAWTRRLDRFILGTVVAAAIAGALLAFAPSVAIVLHWPLVAAVALAPWIGASHALARASASAVIGLGRERWFGALVIAEPALRLALALALVEPLGATLAALVGFAAAPLVVIAGARALLPRVESDSTPVPLGKAFGAAPRTLVTLALAGSLSVIDVVFAHMRMSGVDAGRYAGLAAIARFPELLAAPFALVLLVRSRVRVLARTSPLRELRSILSTTTAVLAIGVALTGIFRHDVVRMLLDAETFAPVADLLPVLTLGHALIAIAQMVICFGIATGTVGLPVVPFVLLAALVGLLAERATTPAACAWIVVAVGALAVVFTTLVVVVPVLFTRRARARARRPRHSDEGPAPSA